MSMIAPITYENPAAFNAAWYMQQNPDLARAGITTPEQALSHYMNFGKNEGRVPNQALSGANASYNQGLPQGGVRDISVEPLNDWQKTGLSGLAATGNMGLQQFQQGGAMLQALGNQQSINPLAQPAFEQMQAAIQTGTQRMTPEDVQRYMNPYQQEVIDRMTNNVTEAGQRAMAKLEARDVGRSPNSSSAAIQRGVLGAENIRTLGDQTANLLYTGFNDATKQFNDEQGRFLTGAGLYGNMGTGSQNVTDSSALTGLRVGGALSELGLQGIKNQIGAGTTVQAFNQGLVDRTRSALEGQMGYSDAQLNDLLTRLNAIAGNASTQGELSRTPSTLGTISGLASLGADNWGGISDFFKRNF